MVRIIFLIAVIGIALIIWHKISSASGERRKKLILWSIIGGMLAVLGILAITGHLNVITAMIAGLVALLPRAMQLLKYLPVISRMFKHQQAQNQTNEQQTGSQTASENLSTEKAMEILGLKAGYSQEDVIQAHRRMMQKVHPDRGGSDYLAAQINKAKDTLLG